MSSSNEQAFPSPKQILGSGQDYQEIEARPGLTKLEYALIHSTWEPSKDEIDREARFDKNRNPYNDSHKPKLRGLSKIVKDLKIAHFKELLDLSNS